MNSTKSGIRCLHVANLQVKLPNGRKIVVCSREGVDEFVDTVGTDFISVNLTAANEQELNLAYTLMVEVAQKVSSEKIAAGFPESELRKFVEHTRDTLKTLSTDRNWLRSGTVSICHLSFLRAVTCFSVHSSFLKIFISDEGMGAVAKFYASRKKNDTPSLEVAESILRLVKNALTTLSREGLSLEEVFGTVEKTGLLGQFIRCVPIFPESAEIVTLLQKCLQLVKKKLKSGTPTGDILDAVVAGKDGPINERAKADLTRLQSLARLSNNNKTYTKIKMCGHCDKPETPMDSAKLMKCQRCKLAYYCSRDCQVADWKKHKKLCNELVGIANESPSSTSTHKAAQTTMGAFIHANCFDIITEVYKKTQEYNVLKKELFVAIDFYGDAPALRNEFKVLLTSDFFEGSSVADAPDWVRTISQNLKNLYDEVKVKSDRLLVVCRAGNEMITLTPALLPAYGCQLFSDEAVECIGREDYVRMVAYLGQFTTDEYFRRKGVA
jgi:hypothetical protein